MTDSLTKAAQAALDALDNAIDHLPKPYSTGCSNAATDLRAALAAQKAPGFTEMVPIEVYEAAVRGRQEMRDALREEREKTKNLTRALGEAVNGPTFMGEPVIAQQAAQPVAWGQLGMLNGKTYLRMNYDRTPYPPPADVVRNLNLVPLFAAAQPQQAAADHPAYQLGFADGAAQYAHKTRGQIREQSAQPQQDKSKE